LGLRCKGRFCGETCSLIEFLWQSNVFLGKSRKGFMKSGVVR
jgi:hypothetical protein